MFFQLPKEWQYVRGQMQHFERGRISFGVSCPGL